MTIRACELKEDNGKVYLTLLIGKDYAPFRFELPDNPSNPFYEPERESVESMAIQADVNNKALATPDLPKVVRND